MEDDSKWFYSVFGFLKRFLIDSHEFLDLTCLPMVAVFLDGEVVGS